MEEESLVRSEQNITCSYLQNVKLTLHVTMNTPMCQSETSHDAGGMLVMLTER